MIGVYDYTVILTYLSLLSGASGIIVCLKGIGHPYLGMFFLLFSGLCDTFDGKVARSKKTVRNVKSVLVSRLTLCLIWLPSVFFLHVSELPCFAAVWNIPHCRMSI